MEDKKSLKPYLILVAFALMLGISVYWDEIEKNGVIVWSDIVDEEESDYVEEIEEYISKEENIDNKVSYVLVCDGQLSGDKWEFDKEWNYEETLEDIILVIDYQDESKNNITNLLLIQKIIPNGDLFDVFGYTVYSEDGKNIPDRVNKFRYDSEYIKWNELIVKEGFDDVWQSFDYAIHRSFGGVTVDSTHSHSKNTKSKGMKIWQCENTNMNFPSYMDMEYKKLQEKIKNSVI